MRTVAHEVQASATRADVVNIVERYKMNSLPVVDENLKLIGVIDHDDVMEVMEDLADETIAKIAGTEQNIEDDKVSIFKRFLKRAPWLVVTLFAGLINMKIMSTFEKLDGGVLTFVLFFVPLITGMSGNIGIQSSTILVRSMALGLFSSSRNKRDSIAKEFGIGTFSAIIFGIACGFIIFLIEILSGGTMGVSPIALGVIIGTGLVGACLTATLLGIFSPLTFSKFGVDPAIASGPIVAAFNDVLSMSIYFAISWGLASVFFN